ncbi:MAG: hypothetical protein IJO88_01150 [Oscillospiraceae bacterium]|nr:hypothetical protein [Oscillospiraceae bacterium]
MRAYKRSWSPVLWSLLIAMILLAIYQGTMAILEKNGITAGTIELPWLREFLFGSVYIGVLDADVMLFKNIIRGLADVALLFCGFAVSECFAAWYRLETVAAPLRWRELFRKGIWLLLPVLILIVLLGGAIFWALGCVFLFIVGDDFSNAVRKKRSVPGTTFEYRKYHDVLCVRLIGLATVAAALRVRPIVLSAINMGFLNSASVSTEALFCGLGLFWILWNVIRMEFISAKVCGRKVKGWFVVLAVLFGLHLIVCAEGAVDPLALRSKMVQIGFADIVGWQHQLATTYHIVQTARMMMAPLLRSDLLLFVLLEGVLFFLSVEKKPSVRNVLPEDGEELVSKQDPKVVARRQLRACRWYRSSRNICGLILFVLLYILWYRMPTVLRITELLQWLLCEKILVGAAIFVCIIASLVSAHAMKRATGDAVFSEKLSYGEWLHQPKMKKVRGFRTVFLILLVLGWITFAAERAIAVGDPNAPVKVSGFVQWLSTLQNGDPIETRLDMLLLLLDSARDLLWGIALNFGAVYFLLASLEDHGLWLHDYTFGLLVRMWAAIIPICALGGSLFWIFASVATLLTIVLCLTEEGLPVDKEEFVEAATAFYAVAAPALACAGPSPIGKIVTVALIGILAGSVFVTEFELLPLKGRELTVGFRPYMAAGMLLSAWAGIYASAINSRLALLFSLLAQMILLLAAEGHMDAPRILLMEKTKEKAWEVLQKKRDQQFRGWLCASGYLLLQIFACGMIYRKAAGGRLGVLFYIVAVGVPVLAMVNVLRLDTLDNEKIPQTKAKKVTSQLPKWELWQKWDLYGRNLSIILVLAAALLLLFRVRLELPWLQAVRLSMGLDVLKALPYGTCLPIVLAVLTAAAGTYFLVRFLLCGGRLLGGVSLIAVRVPAADVRLSKKEQKQSKKAHEAYVRKLAAERQSYDRVFIRVVDSTGKETVYTESEFEEKVGSAAVLQRSCPISQDGLIITKIGGTQL